MLNLLSELMLFEKRINRIEHVIDRDDLIAIMDAFAEPQSVDHYKNCFVKAVAEALTLLLKYKVSERDITNSLMMYGANPKRIHPVQLKTVGIMADGKKIHIEHTHITSVEEIKAWLRKKTPVVLSIRWSESFYWPYRELRDNRTSEATYEVYKSLGATNEMIKKAKHGVIPYPSDKFIKRKVPLDVSAHAILCVGYDAADDAFLCRNFIGDGGLALDGFFKIEAKCFFDPRLKAANQSVVEAALAIEAEEVE